jgi:hypothetical protein
MALALLVASLVACAVVVRERFATLPHGEWDASAIWNLKAAFLAAPSEHWVDGFTMAIGWSHPDYPLLVSASVARLWTFASNHSTAAPMAFASVVLLSTMLTMGGALLRTSGYVGMALGIGLLLVPEYVFYATTQGADVPMALFVLTGVALLSGPPDPGRLALAGAASGFAAWTKNEGLISALAVLVAYGAATVHSDGWRTALHRTKLFGLGLLPIFAVLVLFSKTLATSSDLLQGIAATQPLEKIENWQRHQFVARYMADVFFHWGRWPVVSPMWFALAWSMAGLVRIRRLPTAALTGTMTVAIMILAYYTVYILTPLDLNWHLRTSWPRLMSQVWPTVVWTAVTSGMTEEHM